MKKMRAFQHPTSSLKIVKTSELNLQPPKRSFEAVRSSMALMQKLQIYRYNIDMYIYIYEYGNNLGIASTKKNLWHPPPRICAHPIHPIHPIYSPGRSQWWWHCPHVGHAQLPELCYPVLSLIVLNLCSINLSLQLQCTDFMSAVS